MTVLGNTTLWLTVLLGVWGSGSAMLAAARRDELLVRSAARTPAALLGVLTVTLMSLFAPVVRQDFNVSLVAASITRGMPWPYALAAVGTTLPAILLFLAWAVALAGSVEIRRDPSPASSGRVARAACAMVLGLSLSVLFLAPFDRLGYTPLEGQGGATVPRHPLALTELALLASGLATLLVAAVKVIARVDAAGRRRVFAHGAQTVAWILLCAGVGLRFWRRYAVLSLDTVEVWQGGVIAPWVLAGAAFYSGLRSRPPRALALAGLALLVLAAAGRALGGSRDVRLRTGGEETVDAPGGPVVLSSFGVSRFEIAGGLTSAATLSARRSGGRSGLLTTEQRVYVDVFGHPVGPAQVRPAVLHGLVSDVRVLYLSPPGTVTTPAPPDEAAVRVSAWPLAWSAWAGFLLLIAAGVAAAAGRRRGS